VSYHSRHGLSDVQLRALGEDADGNIWIAAESALLRLTRSGLVTYDTSDGLGGNSFVSALEGLDGRAYFVNGIRQVWINRFDGSRFTAVRPLTRSGRKLITYMGWGIGQTVLQDHAGDWWVPTGEGLCRFSGPRKFEELSRTPPTAVYTTRDGLPGNDIFHLFEDHRGDLWIGTADVPALTRWERQTGRFRRIGEKDGFVTPNPPAAFAEDGEGDLWVGMLWNGLARFRKGVWTMFQPADDLPDGSLWSIQTDRRGRLWIASSREGLARIDQPASGHPRLIRYSTRQGLASDLIKSIVVDQQGAVYIAGARGIDALDPETGVIRHFGEAEGLAAGDVAASFCDRSGVLWFGTTTGLSRLVPGVARKREPPAVRITRLRVAGVVAPISALGEQNISGLTLNPDQNHIDVDFASPAFRAGAALLYQYRLESEGAWTDPAETRGVSLAGLGSGSYRFEVRAISDGVPSADPAVISFRVLPPVWRRWWSLSLGTLLIGWMLYSAHRYRMSRVIEMERVRTRIAMDLHDDIGSTLSQIGILSEVARQQAGDSPASLSLARLAEISRGVGSSMSDIVWAVNPQRDRGADLIQRMRRFGEELLNGGNIAFDCTAPEAVLAASIPADVRREVYLVFKESVNNIARHANCRSATARLSISSGELRLEVRDDGDGFDTAHGATRGNGLASMSRRAHHVQGTLSILSGSGRGTAILLSVPLRRYLFR
jgi:signal transduction histidine kinase